MPELVRHHIPERIVPGKPLGRHVRHDPRSLAYRVQPMGVPASARWERHTLVLDQGDVSSCTGNAATGVLGSDPFYATLASALRVGLTLDEDEALRLYSDATCFDDADGTYPPDDTGSDGLSVAKACKAAGLISGYLHITSLAAAQTAIQTGPFIVGTNWYAAMDDPDRNGLVHVSGALRGGHEYQCIGYDTTTDLWELVNSWGPGWGNRGRFFYSSADFVRLLRAYGDATVFVPLTQPAPSPAPPVASDAADQRLADDTRAWSAARHAGENAKAAKAVTAWRTTKGL